MSRNYRRKTRPQLRAVASESTRSEQEAKIQRIVRLGERLCVSLETPQLLKYVIIMRSRTLVHRSHGHARGTTVQATDLPR